MSEIADLIELNSKLLESVDKLYDLMMTIHGKSLKVGKERKKIGAMDAEEYHIYLKDKVRELLKEHKGEWARLYPGLDLDNECIRFIAFYSKKYGTSRPVLPKRTLETWLKRSLERSRSGRRGGYR